MQTDRKLPRIEPKPWPEMLCIHKMEYRMSDKRAKKPEEKKIHVKDMYGGYDDEEEMEETSGYQLAVSGMKGIITILIYVVIIVTMIFIGKEAYTIGYSVFNQVPVDTGEGREITVTIEPGMSVMEIGEVLQNEGLIEEEPRVFWIQELLSDYHNEIQPGTYTLKTGMTPDEMIKSMVETAEEEKEAAAQAEATTPTVENEVPTESTETTTEDAGSSEDGDNADDSDSGE